MPDPRQIDIDKFVPYCVQAPQNALDPAQLRTGWQPGFYEYQVSLGDSLANIASRESRKDTTPDGLDWKMICRFNFGVDYPPYVNWSLMKAFGFREADNMTRDKKNYSFKGGEKLYIPYKPGAAKPGSIAPRRTNVINTRSIKPVAADGPSLMSLAIASEFNVTGYSSPSNLVTSGTKNSVHWWIKNITKGGDGKDSGKTGEKVSLTFPEGGADASVGDVIRVYPYIGNKSTINEAIHVQFRIIKVELKEDVARHEIDDGYIRDTDKINKIHNPATVVIGARTKDTGAKFRFTKVEPDSRAANAQKFPWPALAHNDQGFVWKIQNIQGEAKFVNVGGKPENKGSDCLVYGTKPGYVRLEGWMDKAEKCCIFKTVKVVHERELPYRANFLTAKSGVTTKETVESIQKIFAIQNIVLRQIGVKLVPDSSSRAGPQINAADDEVIAQATVMKRGRATNVPGYFNITNVDNQFVHVTTRPNAVASCLINARPGVINFVLAEKLVFTFPGHGIITAMGIGPTAARSLHTYPTEHVANSLAGPLSGINEKYKGPTENVTYDNSDNFNAGSLKEMKMFKTPKSAKAHEEFSGLIISNDGVGAQPNARNDAQWTEAGATFSHEVGHLVALMHRGARGGSTPDLLPSNVKNTMYWTEDANHSPIDWDLIQADVFRGSSLCLKDANKGGLKIKANTYQRNILTGRNGTEVEFTVEVTRKKTRVAGAYINFWVEKKHSAIELKTISDWTPATRKLTNGLTTVKVKFTGARNDSAQLVILAGDNDDLVKLIIRCKVTG